MTDETKRGPTVVDLPKQANTLQALVDNNTRNLPTIIQSAIVLAKVRRASYLAYIEEGFTEAQALELCAK